MATRQETPQDFSRAYGTRVIYEQVPASETGGLFSSVPPGRELLILSLTRH